MRLLLLACIVCLTAIVPARPVRADEAWDAVVRAARQLVAEPRSRVTTTVTDAADPEAGSLTIIERVAPAKTRLQQRHNSKLAVEIVSDGHTAAVRVGGQKEYDPGQQSIVDIATTVRNTGEFPVYVDDEGKIRPEMPPPIHDLKVAAHETLAGAAATVYTFTEQFDDVAVSWRLWISDGDSRPLKYTTDSKGEIKAEGKPGQKVDKHSEVIFEYDPALDIQMPEIKAPEPEKPAPKVTTPESALSFARPAPAALPFSLCESSSSTVFPASVAT